MLEDLVNNMVDFLVPSKKDLDNITKKLDNNIKLDSYDVIVLEKIRLINKIIKDKKEKF